MIFAEAVVGFLLGGHAMVHHPGILTIVLHSWDGCGDVFGDSVCFGWADFQGFGRVVSFAPVSEVHDLDVSVDEVHES